MRLISHALISHALQHRQFTRTRKYRVPGHLEVIEPSFVLREDFRNSFPASGRVSTKRVDDANLKAGYMRDHRMVSKLGIEPTAHPEQQQDVFHVERCRSQFGSELEIVPLSEPGYMLMLETERQRRRKFTIEYVLDRFGAPHVHITCMATPIQIHEIHTQVVRGSCGCFSDELGNENSHIHTRNAASLALTNALSARTDSAQPQRKDDWLRVAATVEDISEQRAAWMADVLVAAVSPQYTDKLAFLAAADVEDRLRRATELFVKCIKENRVSCGRVFFTPAEGFLSPSAISGNSTRASKFAELSCEREELLTMLLMLQTCIRRFLMAGTLHSCISHCAPSLASRYPKLQFIALIYFLILVLGCVVNAFLPLILGALITTFDTPGVAPFPPFGSSPWSYLITHVLLRCLASSSGLAAIRDALWIPLMQYSDRSMFEPVLGGVVGVMTGSYLGECHIYGVTREILTDCLLNYETVKYFGGEGYEAQRYTGGYWRVSDFEEECLSLNLLNLVQTLIIIALALDIVQVVLSLLGTAHLHITSWLCIPNLLHSVLPLARVLALLPLLVALFFPRIIYLFAQPYGYTEEVDV
ncbi:hypothetical protein BD769DRAFT_1394855 [Suillus cothurnatus]|nr:hypothetical protein BD769DRAFT_1394855 [Suillus cothurnatus]